MDHEYWHWQKPGEAWRGVGIYHVTLTVPSREPLLGRLVIPDNDPKQAIVERTELGNALLVCLRSIPEYHPEIQVLQYCLMPDHLHAVWYVRQVMPHGIRYVAQALWRAAKKLGRACSYCRLSDGAMNEKDLLSSIVSAESREDPLREKIGEEAYMQLSPLFTEVPFVRPLSRRGQLQTMIHYVQLNPQRLATKRLMPGFFRVQHDVEIAGRKYDAIGNIKILQAEQYKPVHVRSIWVDDAEQHGDNTKLRDYKNGCIRAARRGTVMVSPFISPHEKAVLDYLLSEHHSIIYLADNGFGE